MQLSLVDNVRGKMSRALSIKAVHIQKKQTPDTKF